MTDNVLITKDDIQIYRPTAEMDDSRILPYILEAQISDLKPVLNDALYYDFLTNFDDTEHAMYAKYQQLLKGKSWTYNATTIYFHGVKPMLSYYALSRFIVNNPFHVTRFGITKKVVTQSEQATMEEIRMLVNDLKSNAMTYQNDLVKFLENNTTDFPLYNTGGFSDPGLRTTSFNFFKA